MSDEPPPYRPEDDKNAFKTTESIPPKSPSKENVDVTTDTTRSPGARVMSGEDLPPRSAEPDPAPPKNLSVIDKKPSGTAQSSANESDHLDQKIRSIERSSPPKRIKSSEQAKSSEKMEPQKIQIILKEDKAQSTTVLVVIPNTKSSEKVAEPEPTPPAEPEKPQPVEPEPTPPAEPEKPQPVEPEPAPPAEPEKPQPVEPEPAPPAELEKPQPVEPESAPPAEPENPQPVEPEPAPPAEPEKPQPVEPEPTPPAEPEKSQPVEPEPAPPAELQPVEPTLRTEPEPEKPQPVEPTLRTEPEPEKPKSVEPALQAEPEPTKVEEKAKSMEKVSEPEKVKSAEKAKEVGKDKSAEKASEPEKAEKVEATKEPEKVKSEEKAKELEKAKSTEKASEPEKANSTEKASEPEKVKSEEKAKSAEKVSKPEKTKSTEKASEPEKVKSEEKTSEPEKAKSSEKASEPEKAESAEKASEPEKAKSTEKVSEPEKAESREKGESKPKLAKSEPRTIHLVVEAIKTRKAAAEPVAAGESQESMPSEPLDKIKPKIVFYKQKRADHYYDIGYDSEPDKAIKHLKKNGYLDCAKLTFLTHGFCSDIHATWMENIKQKLFKMAAKQDVDHNVALIGFGCPSNSYSIYYKQAAFNVKTVAEWVAKFIEKIKQAEPKIAINGIGHNLGAHLLGMASRQSGRSFERISGLDPAGPCFVTKISHCMLKEDDAKYVDVIHTNDLVSEPSASEPLLLGTLTPMGTVDFYPNFGYNQPGTKHGDNYRSIELYEWSIDNPDKFRTNLVLNGKPDHYTPITSYVTSEYEQEMGYYADQVVPPPANNESCYYIKTNSKEPWAPAD